MLSSIGTLQLRAGPIPPLTSLIICDSFAEEIYLPALSRVLFFSFHLC